MRSGAKIVFRILFGFMIAGYPSVIRSEPLPYLTDEEIRRGLVMVRITMMDFDESRPWISARGNLFAVFGLVIPGNRILVLANDIRNAGVIEVAKFSSYKRYMAKVQKIAGEVNLAILSVDDGSFFDDLIPMEYGRDPAPGAGLTAVKIDDLFRVQREAVRSEGMKTTANYETVTFPVFLFSATDTYRDGGAMLCGKKLCGFMGYSNGKTKRTEFFPPSLISEIASGRGEFVSQGFEIGEMVDPVLREYFGAPETNGGALITKIVPGTSADGSLMEGDILLELAGKRIDGKGYYRDPRYGLEPAGLLFFRDAERIRYPGETISARVLRGRTEKNIEIALKKYDLTVERIPRFVEGRVPFHMESGFVFIELSVQYLEKRFGQNWRSRAVEFARIYETERFNSTGRPDRVVIISDVLPDETNRGYENLQSSILLSVEGMSITGVERLEALLSELAKTREFCRIETGSGIPIFLNLKERELIAKRIRKRYGLP
jgi:hypothetical protein